MRTFVRILLNLLLTEYNITQIVFVQREVGFLKDKRRLNGQSSFLSCDGGLGSSLSRFVVAMTRAKMHLVSLFTVQNGTL